MDNDAENNSSAPTAPNAKSAGPSGINAGQSVSKRLQQELMQLMVTSSPPALGITIFNSVADELHPWNLCISTKWQSSIVDWNHPWSSRDTLRWARLQALSRVPVKLPYVSSNGVVYYAHVPS